MSTVACLGPHSVADFRSWETLHPGLIWSVGFLEPFRALSLPVSVSLPSFLFPIPALHFRVEELGMDRQGLTWWPRGLVDLAFLLRTH